MDGTGGGSRPGTPLLRTLVDRASSARALWRQRALTWRLARKKELKRTQGASAAQQTEDAGGQLGATLFDAALKQGVVLFEPTGGLCAGLEACLLNGIRVNRYYCAGSR